jgi:putative ABC transport system permease protein
VIAGRDFDERDRLGAGRVVIVNEAFQRRFAPDGHIVGARITAIDEAFTVVGLTEDVPDRSLREVPEPLVMAPLAQMAAGNITWAALTFVLRTTDGEPLRLAPAVRREIYGITPLDPLTFAGAALVLMTVALAATYVPLQRAVRIDPLVALRYE